ncbi:MULTISPECIES: DUF1062 domain-containing protein [Photorhabdus]|uniref:Photorhabdus luminescens subsp. laumondii TTO1 complete genome segment 14/17 n=1 Tax=Photorhabdus laumondii subsp. laumondii (strain DSM 15139 / CIP 105565 / TT01) TaxID=243265 RepID=Q7N0G4_PHOLL|nr:MULTISPECIES: DUF1062 domain-containing protein [Photorhabdus]AWK43526.1 hypothetical protein A4R40_19515 [Photorhabdus laumondii subsp. laumondii]AXG44205.1 DUF1062 domain-containing protein [Photorhabdus laumondii subsp. laumondii]AXG48833.1 DUF1062 domain-containing protein [Photorhabdus laumondii subsp. laumondii]MCC8388772.1 DUF1062 domain-containing protein [Photorhabdus laumondii]MCZ1249970.1 DUF1062 domain-containing protein [Photorhabdus laumondii subsp. laumondii]
MTNRNVIWLVRPVGYQAILKRCPGCEVKKEFYPAGTFRVNAQKKVLDVWSIYKCEKCDYTWNIDIFSRIHVNKLESNLYERFLHNDQDEIRRYAFDYRVLAKNRAELGTAPDFIIEGKKLQDIAQIPAAEITIQLEYPIPIRLISILTKKLALSRSRVEKLVGQGAIQGVTETELNKKLKRDITLSVNVNNLLQEYDNYGV